MSVEAPNLTKLLTDYSEGKDEVLDALLPQVYQELRRLAGKYMARERNGHTLQPTALVNEAFLKISRAKGIEWQNREHFFAIAAQAMRRILTDHAKAKYAKKRGGDNIKISFDEKMHWADHTHPDFVALDEALTELEQLNERQARVVELRYYAGLNVEEAAQVLGTSAATVKRDWSVAKAWLFNKLNERDKD